MDEIVPIERLEEEPYGRVICYPRYDPEELRRRLAEMRGLDVKALCWTGQKNVNNLRVLGKGCVGIVVLAFIRTGKVAVKIRRMDAGRSEMKHEAEMLRTANSVGVGPKLLSLSDNFLIMEFIEGPLLPRWIENLEEGKNARQRIRRVLRDILEQCWRLDEAGLDHGELSRAPKHIVIDFRDKVYVLDFETASTSRAVSNVTSICQYLYMSRKTAELICRRIGETKRTDLLEALRKYKKSQNREDFEDILRTCLL